MTTADLLKSAPQSPIPLYGHFNTKSGKYDPDIATELVRVCGGLSFRATEEGVETAKALLVLRPEARRACLLNHEFGDWDWNDDGFDTLRTRCDWLVDQKFDIDLVLLHYEWSRAWKRGQQSKYFRPSFDQCNIVYNIVKTRLPQSKVMWYMLPGRGLTKSACGGVSDNVPLDVLSDADSCSLYSADAGVNNLISLLNLRTRDGRPCAFFNEVEGYALDGGYSTRELIPHLSPMLYDDDTLTDMGKLLKKRRIREQIGEAFLYPGHSEHDIDPDDWCRRIVRLVEAML